MYRPPFSKQANSNIKFGPETNVVELLPARRGEAIKEITPPGLLQPTQQYLYWLKYNISQAARTSPIGIWGPIVDIGSLGMGVGLPIYLGVKAERAAKAAPKPNASPGLWQRMKNLFSKMSQRALPLIRGRSAMMKRASVQLNPNDPFSIPEIPFNRQAWIKARKYAYLRDKFKDIFLKVRYL